MEVAGQPLARLALRTRPCEKFDSGEDDKSGGKCVFAGDQPPCRYEVEPVDSVLEREGDLVGVGEVEMSERIVGREEERIADSHRGVARGRYEAFCRTLALICWTKSATAAPSVESTRSANCGSSAMTSRSVECVSALVR